jgi:hypothetical protein
MIKIEFKYAIGDKVFFIDDDIIYEKEIVDIYYNEYLHHTRGFDKEKFVYVFKIPNYLGGTSKVQKKVDKVFSTKEELIENLINANNPYEKEET